MLLQFIYQLAPGRPSRTSTLWSNPGNKRFLEEPSNFFNWKKGKIADVLGGVCNIFWNGDLQLVLQLNWWKASLSNQLDPERGDKKESLMTVKYKIWLATRKESCEIESNKFARSSIVFCRLCEGYTFRRIYSYKDILYQRKRIHLQKMELE